MTSSQREADDEISTYDGFPYLQPIPPATMSPLAEVLAMMNGPLTIEEVEARMAALGVAPAKPSPTRRPL